MNDKERSNIFERIWDGIFYVGIVLVLTALSYDIINYIQRR